MRITVTGEPQNVAADLGAGRQLLQNNSASNILVARTQSGLGDELLLPAGTQLDFRLGGQEYSSSQLWVRLEDPESDEVQVTTFRTE